LLRLNSENCFLQNTVFWIDYCTLEIREKNNSSRAGIRVMVWHKTVHFIQLFEDL
jgi:hypothetical protein